MTKQPSLPFPIDLAHTGLGIEVEVPPVRVVFGPPVSPTPPTTDPRVRFLHWVLVVAGERAADWGIDQLIQFFQTLGLRDEGRELPRAA